MVLPENPLSAGYCIIASENKGSLDPYSDFIRHCCLGSAG